jgi:hypothetical protein
LDGEEFAGRGGEEVGVTLRSRIARLRDLLHGGPPGDGPRLARALARSEREIAELPYEVVDAFSPDGRHLFRAAGSPEQVVFTQEQRATLRGAVLIHNHPGGGSFSFYGDPTRPGSRGDVEAACLHEMARTIVVGKALAGRGWRYTMAPPPDGWSHAFWEETVRPVLDRTLLTEYERLIAAVRQSDQVPPTDPDWAHRVWEGVARETSVQYRRERR